MEATKSVEPHPSHQQYDRHSAFEASTPKVVSKNMMHKELLQPEKKQIDGRSHACNQGHWRDDQQHGYGVEEGRRKKEGTGKLYCFN